GDPMTTLYKPVLIESAEQAEALPIGTVATRTSRFEHTTGNVRHQDDVAIKLDTTEWHASLYTYWCGSQTMVGWTALVPIEAEEEWALVLDDEGSMDIGADEAEVREWVLLGDEPRPPVTRLVTPWEEA